MDSEKANVKDMGIWEIRRDPEVRRFEAMIPELEFPDLASIPDYIRIELPTGPVVLKTVPRKGAKGRRIHVNPKVNYDKSLDIIQAQVSESKAVHYHMHRVRHDPFVATPALGAVVGVIAAVGRLLGIP